MSDVKESHPPSPRGKKRVGGRKKRKKKKGSFKSLNGGGKKGAALAEAVGHAPQLLKSRRGKSS